jgi:hypothetical protein
MSELTPKNPARGELDADSQNHQPACFRSCVHAVVDRSFVASTLDRSSRLSSFDGLSIRCYRSLY